MKRILLSVTALLLVVSLLPACGGDKKEQASRDERALTSQVPGDQQMSERAPFEAEGISRNFVAAQTYWKNGKNDRSARELREAATTIQGIAGRGDTDSKRELLARAEDLRVLAREVEAGAVRSDQEMENHFYRAYNALANYHLAKANEYWSRELVNETGENLEAAGDYLDEAASWGGRKIDAATDRAVNSARAVSRRIRQGARWTSDEIGEALTGVGDRIKQRGQEMDIPDKNAQR